MTSSSRLIVAILLVVLLAAGFWILLLGPKREEADDLSVEVEQQQASLAQSQAKIVEATAARREFPSDYRQLVVLGKAVPDSDDTASLLVQMNQIARDSGVKFQSIQLSSASSGESAAATPETATPAPEAAAGSSATSASASVPPTEAAAALLPIGATIGSAGLGVMPYDLAFTGGFFDVADFIHGVDSLVHTDESDVAVDGRLITLDGFALNAAPDGFPNLEATFSVTAYLVPPNQGVTAGATTEAPATEVPASEVAR